MRSRGPVPRRRLVDRDVESADDDMVRRTILRITRNAGDTEDVRQETALKVWQHLPTLEDRTRVRPWILRIAAREALRLLA